MHHLALPWGCDFAFANAELNFNQMDHITEFVNEFNKVNLTFQYSTPTQFLNALKTDNVSWPTKYDDGFPYSDNLEDFWTGFFSNRPNKKKQIKDVSAYFHSSQKLMASEVLRENVTQLRVDDILEASKGLFDVMGVNQHHDAITGTDNQKVADDYSR